MTAVDTEIDIQLLVGDMPVLGCESPVHGSDSCHADGDERYLKVHLPDCSCQNGIFIYCGRFVRFLFSHGNLQCVCAACRTPFIMGEVITDLGPANK